MIKLYKILLFSKISIFAGLIFISCVILPSSNESENIFPFFSRFLSMYLIDKVKNIIIIVSPIPYLALTATPIPIVIRAKKIISSNGFLTGFLNLTIDKAPIVPSENYVITIKVVIKLLLMTIKCSIVMMICCCLICCLGIVAIPHK